MKIARTIMVFLIFLIISACSTTTYQQPSPTEEPTVYSSKSSDEITSSNNDYSSDSGNTNQTYSNSNSDTSWFTGGNLHKSTVKEWRNATYANRLATSADYVVGYLDITDFSDMATIKQEAKDLETCISITASGGDADDEKVSSIGAMCLVLLFPK